MKQRSIILFTLFTLLLAACGANPVDKLKDKAAEKLVETVLEKATDLDNVEIDTDGETVSFSVDDGSGEEAIIVIDTGIDDGSASITIDDGDGETSVMEVDTNNEDGTVTLNMEDGDGEVAHVVVDVDEDGESASIIVDGEDGETMNFEASSEGAIRSIQGMGFDIALPEGLGSGSEQRIEANGEASMVTAELAADNITDKEFFDRMHETLVAEGFTYQDLSGENLEKPDPAKPLSILVTNYNHPDGFTFVILWQGDHVLLSLAKE